MPVVELFVLAQGVLQVAFVPQQAAVEKLVPVSTVWMPAWARISSMSAGNFPSRSRIR
ncbi:hypothetical protein [Nonomuraea lactucae]|uniref:hypothetical protein n=1 Tax=Nonomuraea lactucae TaxID=2249762 RepID=UPI0013B46198|nr:hypothetical protein [Nonomuraea lactucae]